MRRCACVLPGIEILSLTITEPIPGSGSQEWQYIATLGSNTEISVQVPDTLSLAVAPQVQHESAPFRVQPCLRTLDANVSEAQDLFLGALMSK